jgi:hypothetical protein
MSALAELQCCYRPTHHMEELNADRRIACLRCGAWWTVPEYDALLAAEAVEERREEEAMEPRDAA